MINTSLLRHLARFHAIRALVLGDVMLDRFVYGSVKRISPEAPVPVMAIRNHADMAGGAGNVARNLAALGARATILGVVGRDAWGESLQAQLSKLAGVETGLVVDTSRETTVKTRYVAEGQQVLRADRETPVALSTEMEAQLLAAYRRALGHADIVILSDYGKGVLSESVVSSAISMARGAGKQVIVDPKAKTFERYRGATVLKPNRSELQAACGFECETDKQIEKACRQIINGGDRETMVVTRGKDGMSVVPSNGPALHLRTTAREVFDVSGAGDTVAAALALALAAGASLPEACSLANLAAGIVVGKRGTAVVTPSEITAALRPYETGLEQPDFFCYDRVAQLAREWRSEGLKVAFTNGCFDLLHPGHVALIEQARRTADRLIIGLNADASVRKLKGPSRPLQNEIARATVLASLRSVDAVVIFNEDTPLRLIEGLMPDVLVKGADYTLDQVVGADLVTRRGGKVVLADLVSGHSTSGTMQRMHATATA
jgi:D-beta-D-heptose 7-phosphate kinase / D-beta-D-heptose 1-phosphate adenosyltransferase